jgi:predicted dehydrogenase
MAKLRLVQVGLGVWGLDWAVEVLPHVRDVEPVGYVDPDPAALRRISAALGVGPELCFPSLAEALAQVDCDAVLASLPTAFHVPVARVALEAGKHVIVEKPFAPTLEGAAGLVWLAEARGLTLMVSQNYRHYPARSPRPTSWRRGRSAGPWRSRSTSAATRWSRATATGTSPTRCWPTCRSTTST